MLPQGWKFGAVHGRAGVFPGEFVQPVAAPDFINLPVDKKDEPKNKQGHVAASAAVAVAVGSTAAAHELDRSTEVCFADMKSSHLVTFGSILCLLDMNFIYNITSHGLIFNEDKDLID